MAHVTIERIALVQAHIVEAVTVTTPSSVVPESQQDLLLAQSCGEACDLLGDWLEDPWWRRDASLENKAIKELLPVQKEFAAFLGPALKDVMDRAKRNGAQIPDDAVDDAYRLVTATVRRFPRMKDKDLLEEAWNRVKKLKGEVCRLAADVRGGKKPDPVWRRRALRAVKAVRGQLVAVVLAMLAASPAAMAHNAASWGEPAVHAAEVIAVHYVAAQAQPQLAVAPPQAGPRIR